MNLGTLLAALAPALALGALVGTPNYGATAPHALNQRAPQKAPNFTFDHLYDLQIKFLDNFLYPHNAVQVSSIGAQASLEDIG